MSDTIIIGGRAQELDRFRRIRLRPLPVPAAPDGVDARISALRRLWDETERDRRDAGRAIDFLHGDQITATPGMPDEPYWHQDQKPRFAANLCGYIVGQLSRLYIDGAKRDSEDAERWADILWNRGAGLDAMIDDAMPTDRLCGTALAYVAPAWGDGPQSVDAVLASTDEPSGLEVYILPMGRWVHLGHRGDPRYPAAVAIQYDVLVDETSAGKKSTVVHHYWDAERMIVLHNWMPVAGMEYPHSYGLCPVIPLKATLSPLTSYGLPLGGQDLIRDCISINSCIEEVLHTSRLQRGQPVVAGIAKDLQLGPDSPVRVDAPGDFAIIDNGADIGQMVAGIEAAWMRLERSVGLAPPDGSQRADIEDDRQRQIHVWRQNEREIHRVAAAVWRHHTGEELSADVAVTYPDRRPALSHAEMMDEVRLFLTEGLASRREVRERLQPWITNVDELLEEADADGPARLRWRALIAGHAGDLGTMDGNQALPMEQPEDEEEDNAN